MEFLQFNPLPSDLFVRLAELFLDQLMLYSQYTRAVLLDSVPTFSNQQLRLQLDYQQIFGVQLGLQVSELAF